jgi:hypothetical protein
MEKCSKMSMESKEKMRQKKLGTIPWNKGKKGIQVAWNKGKVGVLEETSQKLSEASRGRIPWNKGKTNVYPAETLAMMARAKKGKPNLFIVGEKHPQWKGGVETKDKVLRKSIEARLWREAVFARDGWVCQICSKIGTVLNAHHKKSWKDHPELRFAIDNGITLCTKCHKQVHSVKEKVA